MRFLVYGDIHWSSNSSIVRSNGEKYSTRLENLIKSVSWAESMAVEKGCDSILCLGDFFDKETISSQEVTALSQVKWSSLPHIMLVGNHEMGRNDLKYSSMHFFNSMENFEVIDEPVCKWTGRGETQLVFLPYVTESNRLSSLQEYLQSEKGVNYPTVVFSHNDIAGIQMGKFKSVNGFDIQDVEDNCDLFINGHLHNGGWVTDTILNVGNLTGQNFSEDATRYQHCVAIVDTSAMTVDLIQNPHAMNFYKFESFTEYTSTPITNAVVTVKADYSNATSVRDYISSDKNVIASMVVVNRSDEVAEPQMQFETVDHLQQFQEFILDNMGNGEIVLSELEEVCR